MKAIIFDLNRTLYIPGIGFPEENIKLLQELSGMKLALLSTNEKNLDFFEIKNFFSFFKIVEGDKTKQDIEKILEKLKVSKEECILVGDRVKKEIRAGNEAGITTVWFKQGKFSEETPEKEIEKPNYVITELKDIKEILNL